MADEGIAFLDALHELPRTVSEGLREPHEQGSVTLRRAGEAATPPAPFRLVAATNPYPCGECAETQAIRRCTAEQVARDATHRAGTIIDSPQRNPIPAVRFFVREPRRVYNSLIRSERSPSPRTCQPGLTGDPWANRSWFGAGIGDERQAAAINRTWGTLGASGVRTNRRRASSTRFLAAQAFGR